MDPYTIPRIRLSYQRVADEKEKFPDYEKIQGTLTRFFETVSLCSIIPEERLGIGIVLRACVDYKMLTHAISSEKCIHKKAAMEHHLMEIGEFLKSSWCRTLIGGERNFKIFLTKEVLDSIPTATFERALRAVSGAGDYE